MGSLPGALACELKSKLGLRRAVETGTFMGGGARALAQIFDNVVTIELAEDLHEQAKEALVDVPNVRLVLGDSRRELRPIAAEHVPTLYWLDGHWSGGATAGVGDECPVLEELAALGEGHADDCILIDDARLFAAAPPRPHDARHWPALLEVIDAIRATRPDRHITVLHDLVIAVPNTAKELVDNFGRQPASSSPSATALRRRTAAAGSRLVAAVADVIRRTVRFSRSGRAPARGPSP